ncbi:hypothetical protein YC2023_050931 [Brassica napus]
MHTHGKVALITGGDSGIGRATPRVRILKTSDSESRHNNNLRVPKKRLPHGAPRSGATPLSQNRPMICSPESQLLSLQF